MQEAGTLYSGAVEMQNSVEMKMIALVRKWITGPV